MTKLVAVVISMAMACVILSIATFLYFFENPSIRYGDRGKPWTYDELLGWKHIPGHKGSFSTKSFTVQIDVSSRGMRDKEYAYSRNQKKRMLVLGDSFAWGWGVDMRHIFSEILESRYPDWEIINSSVPGYGTDQQYLYFKEHGIKYKADVTVLLFCQNDLQNNNSGEQYSYYKPFFREQSLNMMLHNVPVPASTLKQRLTRFLNQYKTASLLMPKSFLEGHPEGRNERITLKLLDMINVLATQNASRFILTSVPMGKVDRQSIRVHAKEKGFDYLPLDKYFSKSKINYKYKNDSHWNKEGHLIAANALEEFLVAEGVFSRDMR